MDPAITRRILLQHGHAAFIKTDKPAALNCTCHPDDIRAALKLGRYIRAAHDTERTTLVRELLMQTLYRLASVVTGEAHELYSDDTIHWPDAIAFALDLLQPFRPNSIAAAFDRTLITFRSRAEHLDRDIENWLTARLERLDDAWSNAARDRPRLDI